MNALASIGKKIDPLIRSSHRESDDNYARVVARLDDGWRVIVCRDDLQWILQRRDGERAGGARWAGVVYCPDPRSALASLPGLQRSDCPV